MDTVFYFWSRTNCKQNKSNKAQDTIKKYPENRIEGYVLLAIFFIIINQDQSLRHPRHKRSDGKLWS